MQNMKTMLTMFKQLMYILNKKQRTQCVILFFILLVTATLETLGVSVIIPFITALIMPEELMANRYVKQLMILFHIETYMGILFLTVFMIIAVYVVKNTIIILGNYYQLKVRNHIEKDLSILMLTSYLKRPYTYFLSTNSSEMMRGTNNDIVNVATVVDSFSGFIAEALTCLLIGSMLIYINPLMAIGLICLAGVTGIGVVLAFKKKTAECGVESRKAFAERYQHIQQPLAGFKEISVLKKEDYFIEQFSSSAKKACDYNTTYLFISKLPSRIIETIFIAGLLLLACISIQNGQNANSYVAQLGTLAVAAVRILPSVSNMMNYINGLVFSRTALEAAYDNIREAKTYCSELQSKEEHGLEKNANTDIYPDRTLYIRNISWKYDGGKKNVLEDLSLTIQNGEAVAFVGESGAGKTTLVDVILGLLHPQKGQVLYGNWNIFEMPYEWAKLIGYVPQNVFLIDDTIRNNVALGIPQAEISDEKVYRALEQAQLKDFVMNLPDGLDTMVGEGGIKFSGGQRQRIAIARALYYDPQILVLDEATSALDNDTEAAVMEAINSLHGKKTLIIVAHRLSTIEKCDKVYRIENGKAYVHG